MSAYAVAHLRSVDIGPPIVEYLQGIDATLEPFSGRFILHGGQPEVVEGEWVGHLIVIEFPDLEAAKGWYQSPAYQAILPLRTENSEGVAFLVERVDADHKATDVLTP